MAPRTSEPRLPANFVMPERTDYPGHRCMCELTNEDGTVRDRCGMRTYTPDQPLCDSCTDAGHDALPNYRTARERGRTW